MLVDGFPYYDWSSADMLSVDDISIAIIILDGLRSRFARIIPWVSNQSQFKQDVSSFETYLETAIRAFEELRVSAIRNKQISGGWDVHPGGEDFPTDELSIAIAILNNAKIRAQLSISNPWGQSLLDPGQQETLDKASSAIERAIELLRKLQN